MLNSFAEYRPYYPLLLFCGGGGVARLTLERVSSSGGTLVEQGGRMNN